MTFLASAILGMACATRMTLLASAILGRAGRKPRQHADAQIEKWRVNAASGPER